VVPLVSVPQSYGPEGDGIGDPKGVILTNHNIIQAVISNGLGVTDGFTGEEEWRFLAFMPLSHM
jgi:long-subunit acyl-CoA synthetase (AMP-forming)